MNEMKGACQQRFGSNYQRLLVLLYLAGVIPLCRSFLQVQQACHHHLNPRWDTGFSLGLSMPLALSSHHSFTGSIEVLFESDRILAINKPPGVAHHDDGDEGSGILSVIRQQQQQQQAHNDEQHSIPSIAYKGRLYGVHRLDRVTSGILLLAKDQEMASILTQQFREGNIMKYYTGISAKKPSKKKQGWVKGHMVKGRRKSWFLSTSGGGGGNSTSSASDGGKEKKKQNYAVTRFFTAGLSGLSSQLVSFDIMSADVPPPKTQILFQPLTGRTHQLRVAAKSVGLPLLGDPIYSDGSSSSRSSSGNDNGNSNTQSEDASTIMNTTTGSGRRTYLHATAVHLQVNDENITIVSPPPFDNLWNGDGKSDYRSVVKNMFVKHCECQAIIDMIEQEM